MENRTEVEVEVDVVVVGAGQAGLASAYELDRRLGRGSARYVVLDANTGPGGAWRHRWPSLTLDAVHAIHDLPGLPLGPVDPTEPAAAVMERYCTVYEDTFALPVRRPVTVRKVSEAGSDRRLRVETDYGTWSARGLLNATGTWDRPFWPYYPGRETFVGDQLHVHDFRSAADFTGRRVVVVGGGTSAVQLLLQISRVAETTWVTRRPPQFLRRPFDPEWGADVERRVAERVEAGLPAGSVVSNTGLPLTDQ